MQVINITMTCCLRFIANVNLKHGGGVARAIADKGAPVINEQSAQWIEKYGPLEPGETAITDAGGNLRCKKVIHGNYK